MSLFSNWTLQSSFTQFNSISLSIATGFAMFTPSNSSNYVSDSGSGKIFILDESWSYVSSKSFSSPSYLTTIGSSLYVTGFKNVWKLDKNLNILIQYNATGAPSYRGIYYNSTNKLIYVAPAGLNVLHVFDLNLSLSYNISTSGYYPCSIAEYNNQLYVGDSKIGTILVLLNEAIIKNYNGCNGNSVRLSSILFDNCGYMATNCNDIPNTINQLYLYDPNGTYLSKNFTTPTGPRYIGYDSKGHFIQISWTQISIYN